MNIIQKLMTITVLYTMDTIGSAIITLAAIISLHLQVFGCISFFQLLSSFAFSFASVSS